MEKDKFFEIPVVFIIFNRPDTTRKVWGQISAVKPKKLYIIADGARENVAGEIDKVKEARRVTQAVDWECDIKYNYADSNMGCRDRIVSGIDWVFEQEDMAIILEDDCYPDLSFFYFCKEILCRYSDNEKITSVAARNVIDTCFDMCNSYTFSYYHNIWGWATWRRAWRLNDAYMTGYDRRKMHKLLNRMYGFRIGVQWANAYESVSKGRTDVWDFQWEYAQQLQGGLTIVPEVNLVRNIGRTDGTHIGGGQKPAKSEELQWSAVDKRISFPLRHPEIIEHDNKYDRVYGQVVRRKNWITQMKIMIKYVVGII